MNRFTTKYALLELFDKQLSTYMYFIVKYICISLLCFAFVSMFTACNFFHLLVLVCATIVLSNQ